MAAKVYFPANQIILIFSGDDRRNCAELYLRHKHLLEEKTILLGEMNQTLQFFSSKLKCLSVSHDALGNLFYLFNFFEIGTVFLLTSFS